MRATLERIKAIAEAGEPSGAEWVIHSGQKTRSTGPLPTTL
jgi:hypothetical protein